MADEPVDVDKIDTEVETPENPEDNIEIESDDEEETKPEDKKEPVEDDEPERPIEVRERKEEKVEYGEDIDPEDVKTIGAIVDKQTASLKKTVQDTQDRLEVSNFIKDNPNFSKYESQILKYVQHPAYSQIPVRNIASMLAANDLMKIGAQKEREAQAKADATKTPGTPARTPDRGATDWTKAPKEAFEAQKRKVLGQAS